MQVNNNYQPSFQGVFISNKLQNAIKKGNIKKRSLQFIEVLKKQYEKSPVHTILDLADTSGNRLDAQIFYGKVNSPIANKTFGYYEEDSVLNFFGMGKKAFIDKVKNIITKLEKAF